MALLTASKESALTEAGNSALTSNIILRLAGNFYLCACALHITGHYLLAQLAQKFGVCTGSREYVMIRQILGRVEIGP